MYSLILIYLIGVLLTTKTAMDGSAHDGIVYPLFLYLIAGLAWPITMWLILFDYKRP